MRAPVLACVLAFASACGPSAAEKDRAAVANAIDELRALPDGDVEGRARLSNQLAQLDVHDADALAARDACARAFGMIAQMDRLIAVASAGINGGTSSAGSKESLQAIHDASELMEPAKASMEACTDASARMRVKR